MIYPIDRGVALQDYEDTDWSFHDAIHVCTKAWLGDEFHSLEWLRVATVTMADGSQILPVAEVKVRFCQNTDPVDKLNKSFWLAEKFGRTLQ